MFGEEMSLLLQAFPPQFQHRNLRSLLGQLNPLGVVLYFALHKSKCTTISQALTAKGGNIRMKETLV